MKKILMVEFIILILFIWMTMILNSKDNHSAPMKAVKATLLQTKEIALVNKKVPGLPDKILLDVPLINQMDEPALFNGCEVTSLAMILKYHGVKVSKNELANNIKTVPFAYNNGKKGNPNVGFVGDMANGPGLGVYHDPVLKLAKKYVGNRAVNLTNHPFSDVLKEVGQGRPVWVIITASYTPVSVFQTWDTPQGIIKVTYREHSAAITGYDEDHIYVNDPYGEKNKKLNKESFIKAWKQMGKQAIVIKEA